MLARRTVRDRRRRETSAQGREENAVADVWEVIAIIAAFVLLAVVARAAEKLVSRP